MRKITRPKEAPEKADWVVLQDRAYPDEVKWYNDMKYKYDRMLIFMQEPRQTRRGYAYLNQRIVDLVEDQEKSGTISRKQR